MLYRVVTMEFYGRNDITLGGFLERFCFRPQYSCPSPTCGTPMTDHVRRFVHGTACINVLLKKLDNEVPGGKENILMWSWCRKCKQVREKIEHLSVAKVMCCHIVMFCYHIIFTNMMFFCCCCYSHFCDQNNRPIYEM